MAEFTHAILISCEAFGQKALLVSMDRLEELVAEAAEYAHDAAQALGQWCLLTVEVSGHVEGRGIDHLEIEDCAAPIPLDSADFTASEPSPDDRYQENNFRGVYLEVSEDRTFTVIAARKHEDLIWRSAWMRLPKNTEET